VVREYLLSDLESGLFTRQEYDQLGSVFGRMGSSFNALTERGVRGWRSRMKFNQLASELAFHRCRVSRGIHSTNVDINEVEQAYVHLLQSLASEMRTQ
jgi:protease PrsW